ncbi:MAG: transglutaminase protein, partial [Clostridia bacterium]|nr:transglutaminase protein [Clostridia bacterium]
MRKKLFELIFFIILITIMVMSLNMAILDSTGMEIKPFTLLKYTFLIVAAIAVLLSYRIALAGAGVLTAAAGIYAYARHIVIPAKVFSYIAEFFTWLPQYIVGYASFELKYSVIFSALYIILVTLIICLMVFNRKGYGLLILLGTAAFAFFWFIYVSKARLYMFYYLSAALVLYSYNVFDRKRMEWVKSESSIDKYIEFKWILNSFIIVFISIAISQFAVLDIKPVQWNWLNEKAIQVFPFIEGWRNDNLEGNGFSFSSRYDISRAGYDTARLGGPVNLNESIMLTLETNAVDNIYLKGRVKDFYTGSSWRKNKKSDVLYNSESEIALPFGSDIRTYQRQIRITHQKLITSTIFAPNTLNRVDIGSRKYHYDEDGEAYVDRMISKKDQYTVTSRIPYINVNKLRQIETAGLVSDDYKQLPDNISDRVKQLSLSITDKYDNDYDKAKAIEQYLRENFKYTLSPSEIPKNAEFVDYFLFEGKEGYCTYFATSMAVMLRASGIPGRYVEGFLAEYDNSFVRNVPGTNAHAWVEVNFGPYGWITFEATPAYPLQGFAAQGEVATAPIPEPTPSDPAVPQAPVEQTTRDRNLEMEDEEGTDTDLQAKKEISLTTRIILALFAILMLRVLYLLLKTLYLELRIREASGRHYAVRSFESILRYLKKIGIRMDKEETMREFWFKVKYALDEEYKDGDEI